MALVAYSDSEGSDNEAPSVPESKATINPDTKAIDTKSASFQKTEPRKVKVALPALRAEPGQQSDHDVEGPPVKRARTGGAFGGFNSLLPAPKRTVEKGSGLGRGVSLKTSSEAAFSRAPPSAPEESAGYAQETQAQAAEGYDEFGNRTENASGQVSQAGGDTKQVGTTEVKIIGKATRFRPLCVANNKKKTAKKLTAKPTHSPAVQTVSETARHEDAMKRPDAEEPSDLKPLPKPKRSLFSVQHDEPPDELLTTDDYDSASSIAAQSTRPIDSATSSSALDIPSLPANSLEAVAADLNLTAAQRRQLLGRNAGRSEVKITQFNMDNEYRANEQLRQAGETVEHRAVKSIAPGKHSLQQLVNNARSNQDSIEDKWAEGKRNRSEGGSKYGF